MDYSLLIKEQKNCLQRHLIQEKKQIILSVLSPEIRKIKKKYLQIVKAGIDNEEIFYKLYDCTKRLDRNRLYRCINKCSNHLYDANFYKKYGAKRSLVRKQLMEAPNGYLAVMCIVRNEARYVDEWMAFYQMMGVDHIFLFNNSSTDDLIEVSSKWINQGFLTLIDYPGEQAQMPAFRITINTLKGKYRWVALIDIDEFMFPVDSSQNLPGFFSQMESYPAVGVNWIVYGPGGNETTPKGLVMENYYETFADRDNLMNLRIKSVVNPSDVYDVNCPHFCVLKDGKYAVDENGDEIDTKWMFVSNSGPAFTGVNKTERIRINHYWTKSKQELAEKCNRGYAAGGFSPDYENILKRVDYPQMRDESAKKYVDSVKKILQSKC